MHMGCSMAAKKNEQMYVGPEQPLLLTMNVVVVMDQETLRALCFKERLRRHQRGCASAMKIVSKPLLRGKRKK